MCIFYAIEMCKTYAIYFFFLKINFLLNLFFRFYTTLKQWKSPIAETLPEEDNTCLSFAAFIFIFRNLFQPTFFSSFHIFHN